MKIAPDSIQKIELLAEQVVAREGCKLYDVEFTGGTQGRTLRVFIDKAGEGGASLDDCANVSRGLNLLLDVEDPVPGGHYNLEVSTPGVERLLRKAWHFQEAQGKKIWIRLNQPLQDFGIQHKKYVSSKQFVETILSCDETGVKFRIAEEVVVIPFAAVDKAHVVFEFGADKGQKK